MIENSGNTYSVVKNDPIGFAIPEESSELHSQLPQNNMRYNFGKERYQQQFAPQNNFDAFQLQPFAPIWQPPLYNQYIFDLPAQVPGFG